MGALLGLGFGLGVVLVVRARTAPPRQRVRRRPGFLVRLGESLAQADIEAVSPGALLASCGVVGAVVWVLMLLVSHSLVLAVVFGAGAAWLPLAVVRWRVRSRRNELRGMWPDLVDNLASGVRAGLSLPEALAAIGERGPEPLRRPFQRFAADYRATGRFSDCLDRLKTRLADPVGDRIVESLRLAREVGGSDLGILLRTLSAFLREDARARAELETRQGWTVNGARLAVAAPWVLLAMLSLNPEAVAAYDSAAGVVVLATGAGSCALAYRLMLRLGRLPEEERVLR